MSFLLDTHTLVWWLNDDQRLPQRVREELAAGLTRAVVSAVSVWEIEIKRAQGRLETIADIGEHIRLVGFEALPVTFDHAVAAGRLPPHHGDPFDRMLIAQAKVEGLVLVTRDRQIRLYDVPVLWD